MLDWTKTRSLYNNHRARQSMFSQIQAHRYQKYSTQIEPKGRLLNIDCKLIADRLQTQPTNASLQKLWNPTPGFRACRSPGLSQRIESR